MNINPIKIIGSWTDGWALDRHTISSEYIGDDPYGHPRFNNVRSEIGQLVYNLKYCMDYSAVSDIVEVLTEFLNQKDLLSKIDIILPAPPSKSRQLQPVFAIAEETARINSIPYRNDVLIKTSSQQAKTMSIEDKDTLQNTIVLLKHAKRPYNVLLIDDVFQTGSTLNECVRAIREDPKIGDIYVITMTKTMKGV